MLTIRLQRIGKKKMPVYRLIVSEKGRDTHDKYLENLGTYNPQSKELLPNAERIKYWLSKGSQMSNTINNLLVAKGIITGKKMKSVYLSDTRKVKLAEKKKAAAPAAAPAAVPAEPAK